MIGIIDAHHHIWRQADLPWLIGPMQPRIFGPYEPIRRDYPIREYLDDLSGNGVVKSVYVQTNWAKERYEDETAWVQRTSSETGWPHAIVAYADFGADDVRPQLDRLKRYPLVRGVRMQLHWHQNPLYRFAPRADLCADPTLRRLGSLGRRLFGRRLLHRYFFVGGLLGQAKCAQTVGFRRFHLPRIVSRQNRS